jgi:septum formation protein
MDEIILASASPRRKQLLEAAEINHRVEAADIDETPPQGMPLGEVPSYLAREKAKTIAELHPDSIVIGADTIVLLDNQIIGKPTSEADALDMLTTLQGRRHMVVSGVCICKGKKEVVFSVSTLVSFRPLTERQLRHYIAGYKPFDKAGGYAIQEWIGMVGISGIEGDYYNVMGLPVGDVVKVLTDDFGLLMSDSD